jgi:hypothetical protein
MPTINYLSAVTELKAGDQFPIWVPTQGDTRKGTVGQVMAYVGENIELPADQVTYTAPGASAVERTAESKFSDVVSVKDYGAVGDGTADDSAAIQAAIDSFGASGGTLEFEAGKTYKCLSTLTVSTSNLTLNGNGATINGADRAAATALNQIYALKVEGSIGSAILATANINEGDVAIAVSSTSSFAADDVVLVYSLDPYPPNATSSSTDCGALHRIRSIDSGTSFSLYDGTYFSYTTANSASVKKLSPVSNVSIQNLKIVMGGVNKAHCGIRLKYAVECSLIDCVTQATEDTGVRFDHALSCTLSGGDFSNCTSPADGTSGVSGVTGYGVSPADATRDIRIINAKFRNCRHAVSGGGTYPSIETVVSKCFVDGNRSPSLTASYSLDCHEDCVYWTFDKNHVACGDTSTSNGGILVRGQKTRVVGNYISNSYQYGIYVINYDNPGGSDGNVVSENVIVNTRLDGIVVQGSSTSVQTNVQITGNSLYGCGGEGIVLYGTNYGVVADNVIVMSAVANKSGIRLVGTAATSGNQCKNIAIANNIIQSPTLYGIRVDYGDSISISNCQITQSTSDCIYLTNSVVASVIGCRLSTIGATRNGVQVNASTFVSIGNCVGKNTTTASAPSSGVYILGASEDVVVSGCVFDDFVRGVYSVSPANYINVVGVNGRNCTTAAVDVSASANTATAGNL